MIDLVPVFSSRSFAARLLPSLAFKVKTARWAAVGGPSSAALAWSGPSNKVDLTELTGLLRCPVDLWTSGGSRAWWGYVNRIEIQYASHTLTYSLDTVFNRVQVQYQNNDPGKPISTQPILTAWADDLQSQAAYGVRELIVNTRNITAAEAEALRASTLTELANPQPSLSFLPPTTHHLPAAVILHCAGWWSTLNWRYYPQAAGQIENVSVDLDPFPVGFNATLTYVAQEIVTGDVGFYATAVWLLIKIEGAPTDNLVVELCANNAGVPGSVLASASMAGTAMPEGSQGWKQFIFGTPYDLDASSNYWLKFSRSGADSTTNFYRVFADHSAGYAAGAHKYYDSGAWTASTKDACFRLYGTLETTVQIPLMAAAALGGQFLNGTIIEQASGLQAACYRDGTLRAGEEIETLLKAGTSAGAELLAEINADRYLIVKPKPLASAPTWQIAPDGSLRSLAGAPAQPGPNPAGQFARYASPWTNAGYPPDVKFLEAVEFRGGQLYAAPNPSSRQA